MLFEKTNRAIALRGLFTLLLNLVFCYNIGYSFNGKPDFEKIKNEVTDVNSPHYLDKLKTRFLNYDISLNSEELQHLYYGYRLAKKEYNPISYSEKTKALQMLSATKNNYAVATEKCNAFLAKDMFDMDFYHYKGLFEYEQNHDFAASDKVFKFYYNLFKAIKSTGNGISEANPIYIINKNHINFIVKLMGFQLEGAIKEKQTIIEVPLKKNDLGVDVIYFSLLSENTIDKSENKQNDIVIKEEPKQAETSSSTISETPTTTVKSSFAGTSSFVGSYRAASTNTTSQVAETPKEEATNNSETISQNQGAVSKPQPVLSERERILAERKAEREKLMAERIAERERLIAERMAERERLIAERMAQREHLNNERKQQTKEIVKP